MSWLVSLCEPKSKNKVCVSLGYSFKHHAFTVWNRGDYLWGSSELVGMGDFRDRHQVIGTPLAEQVYANVDEIWLNDPYVINFVALAEKQ